MKTLKTVLVGLLFTLLVLVASATLILLFGVYPPQLTTHDGVTKSHAQPAPKKATASKVFTVIPDADGDGYTNMTREDRQRFCRLSPLKPTECAKLFREANIKLGDCDDTDPNVHPGAYELIDGKDNDCDGELWGEEFYDDLADIYGECWNGEECDDSNMNTSDDICVRGVCVGTDNYIRPTSANDLP